jgi:AraC-like DNA-binding protein
MQELILSFVAEQFSYPEQFVIELAGITYPFTHYEVNRDQSTIYSVEYVLAGTGEFHVDDQSFKPTAGQVFILPKGQNHHYWSDKTNPLHKIWFNVRGQLVDTLFQTFHLHAGSYEATSTLPLFWQLLAICQDNQLTQFERSHQAMLLFQELLLLLFEKSKAKNQQTIPLTVNAAREYIDENLATPLTIQQVAQHVNLSSSQLTRQFKQSYGQTPYDYYLRQKLQLAQTLLANTLLPIKEIAARLAFSDDHYFATLFKQKIGMTPFQWRKQLPKKANPTINHS